MTATRQAKTAAGWGAFLTPGWFIAALLIVAFSYVAFTVLAPWQLGKNADVVERNERITAAFEHDPVSYSQVISTDGTLSPDDEWNRVVMTGHYLPDKEVLLRLRPVDRTPAFQVLTAFDIDDGPTILVNRGWVEAQNGGSEVGTIDPAPANTVTLTGFVRVNEAIHSTAPLQDQGHLMVYSINTGQVGELTGTQLVEPYLQLADSQPGVLTAIPLPALDTGNYLSYGLQWIAFGVMAPAGLIYFIVSEVRERRRYREEQEAMSELIDAPEPRPSDTPAPAPARERYGSARRNPWAAAYDRDEER
ncbi:SURF1 family protein [Corynebacterium capitovis DSM 44611]|uniref:SURF1 family cytochrome oxidase biogenesis protein n=1 Tax=Corynebacterium capitovis TaxID=131081 RepID=UPI000380FC32|nr:SURF1 family protein [Corynebacterium capitovis]WKD57291.1 SURF1 family protein [Corynebacterium capitovis DSM 44611]